MADIAFLLLIFFLVTAVIPKDNGIYRKLPSICPPGQICDTEIAERNILEIYVNAENELLLEDKLVTIDQLKNITKEFVNNNGAKSCGYCSGNQIPTASDYPEKAVISLKNDSETTYDFYIKIQDEITKAYFKLRSEFTQNKFGKTLNELTEAELREVKNAYPFKLSEVEMK